VRTTYVFLDGKLVPKTEARQRSGFFVVSDQEGFRSPVDGSWVDGKAAVREHERKYEIRQCGDDYTSSEKPDWWGERHG